jgi:single-stranded-DNA-specific exonuclease
MKKVIRRRPVPTDHSLPESLDPLLTRLYAARGLRSGADLDYRLSRLPAFETLAGIEQASALLAQAIAEQWKILIVADFDADGATSCALAVRALIAMGATRVEYLVPNRFELGHGLTPELVDLAARGGPDLIITVDNGITSVEGVARAHALGIRVLITDHHLPGAALPAAQAIVNPNQPGDRFPVKALAGVGVVFYVMIALRARLRAGGWFDARGIDEPNLAGLLDLVALGTVADLVPLEHANRILVARGLERIRSLRCQSGIAALLRVARRSRAAATAGDLAYAVAPRLNAAGRLADMRLGIECLLATDPTAAAQMAARLDALNRERREIQADMQAQAERLLERHAGDGAAGHGLCLFDPDWHQGLVGVLAGRLKDRLERPVVVFARAEDGLLKGSARSVAGVHIRDLLDAVATRHPGLIARFGGHAMAAGLSLPEGRLEAFREAFAAALARSTGEPAAAGAIYTDGELAPGEIDLAHAELLRREGPWGQGFPEPLFDGTFDVLARRTVGEQHLKLRLREPRGGVEVDAIAFGQAGAPAATPGASLTAVYRLDVNDYRGERSVQLVVEQLGAEPPRAAASL